MDLRLQALQAWLPTVLQEKSFSVVPLAGDASFRRYFRVITPRGNYVAMDALPEKENCKPFIAIAHAFENSAVRLPKIVASNVDDGFLLLSDFGDRQLLPLLKNNTVHELYTAAIDALIPLQKRDCIVSYDLPQFDDTLFWKEFDIFFTWYLQKNLGRRISDAQETALRDTYQLLIHSAQSQPTVFVHRDYHSRNIMLCDDGKLGILDFQDAVKGPVTYDLVSLLRDCYIAWDDEKIECWANYFFEKRRDENITPFSPLFAVEEVAWCESPQREAREREHVGSHHKPDPRRPQQKVENGVNILSSVNFATFMRWFDWMGLQRHIKCLGIFSRLYYRDQKEGYLKEIPRVLQYALSICDKYPELIMLKKYLQ